jgi:hypothetical protein
MHGCSTNVNENRGNEKASPDLFLVRLFLIDILRRLLMD